MTAGQRRTRKSSSRPRTLPKFENKVPQGSSELASLHWARRNDRMVLTCAGGTHHVVIHRNCDGASVFVIKHGVKRTFRIFDAGQWPDRNSAIAAAEDIAAEIGIDLLALPGAWREAAPTTRQMYKFAILRIPWRKDVTKGQAADEIALEYARWVDPSRVVRTWAGPER